MIRAGREAPSPRVLLRQSVVGSTTCQVLVHDQWDVRTVPQAGLMTNDHSRFHEWAGAYVLGALEPGEAISFEQHLYTCTSCQTDVDELSDLRRLLDRCDRASLRGRR